MARKAFFSFHFDNDCHRVAQIRSAGLIEGNQTVSDNDWEAVKRGGDAAIRQWIDGQLYGKSVAIVMIGAQTAGRRWINYEIEKAWNDGKGVFGVYIHNLRNLSGNQASKGANPFASIPLANGAKLSSLVRTYDPPFYDSKDVYGYITQNLSNWVEVAISDRS
ncbi:TIR domain-containing protein [Streptomyces sp. enrichment culture]|uniref:TIR domain-containing protein n=1 Tax=Streptomyces sp. enrichment culture TaxID=1795815 RepID=UPI003F56379C